MQLLKHPRTGRRCAITLLELLIVIAIVVIVALMILPMRNVPDRSPAFGCMNNLRQMALGHLQLQSDHDGSMPWEVSVTNGGTLEHVATGDALAHIRGVSKYIPNPKSLTCLADKERESVSSYADLTQENLSYFLSLQAGTNPVDSILAGDRNLTVDGQPVQSGLLSVSSTNTISWSRAIHGNKRKRPFGFLGFRDGHVEGVYGHVKGVNNLQERFLRSGVTTNRLLIP